VRGRVHDAGDGCQASDYAGARNKVALADSIDPFYVDIIPGWPAPPCTIGRQTVLAARAGAIAFVSNLVIQPLAFVSQRLIGFEFPRQRMFGLDHLDRIELFRRPLAMLAIGKTIEHRHEVRLLGLFQRRAGFLSDQRRGAGEVV
jgi:hypothetical protein